MYSIAINSSIALQDLMVQCQMTPPDPTSLAFESYLYDSNIKPKYGGAIYISDALLVTSSGNIY
jgi:hypothetical protein